MKTALMGIPALVFQIRRDAHGFSGSPSASEWS
jgi:hypothetical protein